MIGKKFTAAAIILAGLCAPFCAASAQETSAVYTVEKVAASSYQWTGIAISKSGRLFVNYPTWDDHPEMMKVAELTSGKAVPYPNISWNDSFICVQSVVIDDRDMLWILDPAKLRGQPVDPKGAALYETDLNTNKIQRVYRFGKDVARPGSYLNDVRIDRNRNKAYITDSGEGGIIVLDLASGNSYRALTDIPEVKANVSYIDFPTTGRNTHVSQSDGLELSADGNTLYFTALGGTILYGVPTEALLDTSLSVGGRQKEIYVINPDNVPADGMIRSGTKLYMANLPAEGLWQVDLATGKGEPIPLAQPIPWADSFAMDPSGQIYFTVSKINYPKDQRRTYEMYQLVKQGI